MRVFTVVRQGPRPEEVLVVSEKNGRLFVAGDSGLCASLKREGVYHWGQRRLIDLSGTLAPPDVGPAFEALQTYFELSSAYLVRL